MDYHTSFHIGTGPLWFVETLLIFALMYGAVRVARPQGSPIDSDWLRCPARGVSWP